MGHDLRFGRVAWIPHVEERRAVLEGDDVAGGRSGRVHDTEVVHRAGAAKNDEDADARGGSVTAPSGDVQMAEEGR